MNIYDIAIGFIIGLMVERASKLSHHLQKLIKKMKENQKAEKARKQALIKSEGEQK